VLVKVKLGFYFYQHLGVSIHMNKYICNKTYKLFALSALPFTLAAMLPKPAQAVQITLDNFGSGAIVESFEGLSPGPNLILPQGADVGYLRPVLPFTFESGVTLTETAEDVSIGDWSIGVANYGLGPAGSVDSAAKVPDGSAYLGFASVSTSVLEFPVLEFTFSSDMLRVGGLITSASSIGLPIALSAFDASGTLLETVTIPSVPVSDWNSNFLGLENTGGIRRVIFNSSQSNFSPMNLVTRFSVLDRLTFEPLSSPSIAVPEPTSALGVFVGAALGASSILKRRQHNLK
jgi:hypothetical protein